MAEGKPQRRVVILDIYDDLTIETETLTPFGAGVTYVSPKAPGTGRSSPRWRRPMPFSSGSIPSRPRPSPG